MEKIDEKYLNWKNSQSLSQIPKDIELGVKFSEARELRVKFWNRTAAVHRGGGRLNAGSGQSQTERDRLDCSLSQSALL